MATIKEIVDELDSILDYEEGSGDVTKASRVVTLVKRLLVRRPDSSGHAGSSVAFNSIQLKSIQDDARIFVKSRASGSSGISFLEMGDYR